MVLWNVRSKRSLAGIWEPGGRTSEEEEKRRKMAGGGSRNKAKQRPAEPTLRRWSRPGIISAQSSDSKPAGWVLPLFGISPKQPQFGSAAGGAVGKPSCCAEPPGP